MKEFKPISGMIKNHIPDGQDSAADEDSQQVIREYWRQNGGIAAPHTYPLLFKSGRLVLFCNSAAWATQVRHQLPSLLRQFNESGFRISEIKTRIRPLSTIRRNQSRPGKTIDPISQDNANAIRALAEKVQHRGLKNSLSRLSARSAKK